MLKATYLFHFASLMYKTYTHCPHMEKNKKLLYIYSVFNAVAGTVCTVLVIIIDLLHERTVFAMYDGYCADFFREPGVSDQVLIALLAVITAAGIFFFIIALTFYHLTTKRFCTCGGITGPSDVRVSITLISAIALGALLLVILLLAGVAGESSVIASSIAVCIEQVVLLIVFLTSRKI